MKEQARKIFKMRDPERLFVLAMLLSPYADKEGHLKQAPLKLLQDLLYPGRRDMGSAMARLVGLMRRAGYLENTNVGGNRGDWVLHLPQGTQSLAGRELATQMQLLTDVTELVQRWGVEKIPNIINALEGMQQKQK